MSGSDNDSKQHKQQHKQQQQKQHKQQQHKQKQHKQRHKQQRRPMTDRRRAPDEQEDALEHDTICAVVIVY